MQTAEIDPHDVEGDRVRWFHFFLCAVVSEAY